MRQRQPLVQIASIVERELAERFMLSDAKKAIFPTSARFLCEFPVGLSQTREPLETKRVDLIGAIKMSGEWGIYDDITAKQARLRLETTNPVRFIENITEAPIWVFEIKPVLDQKAIGQVLTDRDLLEMDLTSFYNSPYELGIRMGIICGKTDRLLEQTCRNHGIDLFIVRPREGGDER